MAGDTVGRQAASQGKAVWHAWGAIAGTQLDPTSQTESKQMQATQPVHTTRYPPTHHMCLLSSDFVPFVAELKLALPAVGIASEVLQPHLVAYTPLCPICHLLQS